MTNLLEIRNLTKHYPKFTLSDISLDLPAGCIMGFMGENGAGKSTTIKSILGLIKPNSGSVRLWGRDQNEAPMDDIGFVLDSCAFSETMNAMQIGRTMQYIYRNWDMPVFRSYLDQFALDPQKRSRIIPGGCR